MKYEIKDRSNTWTYEEFCTQTPWSWKDYGIDVGILKLRKSILSVAVEISTTDNCYFQLIIKSSLQITEGYK